MFIARYAQDVIEKWLFSGKVVRIYGLRRTGKTTLTKAILEKYGHVNAYFNCEIIKYKDLFESLDMAKIRQYFGDYKLIVLDEAQNISQIGLLLKLMVDTYPEIQIIATGSSSFDLANQTGEPLVGRAYTYNLQSISLAELRQHFDYIDLIKKQEDLLIYGSMPSIFETDSYEQKRLFLDEIASSYLFKDILEYENVKSSGILIKLLKALALQVGSQVSSRELGQLLGISPQTVDKYIWLLEQSFIIFPLSSFYRNLRNELKRDVKIYFWDLGVRNALIQNFNMLENRQDVGALWENFCILERIKQTSKDGYDTVNRYFWRTVDQQEIDYIEEGGGVLNCFEFKWNSRKQAKLPKSFQDAYPNHTFSVINKENWLEMVK